MNKTMNNQTYYETIVKSKIWQDWTKYAEDNLLFDMPESIECGWLSDKHWEAFIKWVRQQTLEEAKTCVPFKKLPQGKVIEQDMKKYGYNECIDETLSNLQALKDN